MTIKTAFITGASRGFGKAMAEALALQGVDLLLLARSKASLEETAGCVRLHGRKALALSVDVSNPAEVTEALSRGVEALGVPDLLVNNAGIAPSEVPFWQSDVAEWWRVFEINLRGTVLCTRAILEQMIARGRGRIINICSESGNRPDPRLSAYSTSKAALIHFTDAVATATRSYGISILAYHPGILRTAMTEQLLVSDGGDFARLLKGAFSGGLDTPMIDALTGFMELARGDADALSGCYLTCKEILSGTHRMPGTTADRFRLRVVRDA